MADETPRVRKADLPSYEGREDLPTWTEYAEVKRLLFHQNADMVVLKAELHENKIAKLEFVKLQKQVVELQQKAVLDSIEHERVRALANQQGTALHTLEGENGQLESRLARALGRTVVVAKDDELANLVHLLVRIREWCEASVGKAGSSQETPARFSDQNPMRARVMQIRNEVTVALKNAGVTEEQREKTTIGAGR